MHLNIFLNTFLIFLNNSNMILDTFLNTFLNNMILNKFLNNMIFNIFLNNEILNINKMGIV